MVLYPKILEMQTSSPKLRNGFSLLVRRMERYSWKPLGAEAQEWNNRCQECIRAKEILPFISLEIEAQKPGIKGDKSRCQMAD